MYVLDYIFRLDTYELVTMWHLRYGVHAPLNTNGLHTGGSTSLSISANMIIKY